jgi:dihydrofolate reductase
MRKLMLIMHTSIDGYVAGPNGELDWFENASEHLDFVNELLTEADAALFGRKTYELFQQYWPGVKGSTQASEPEAQFANWYDRVSKIVLSDSLADFGTKNTAVIGSPQLKQQIQKLKAQAGKDIVLFGSPTVAQSLGELGLIDEYMIFINPVFFRKGLPLFSRPGEMSRLRLMDTRTISNGEVALRYRVKD